MTPVYASVKAVSYVEEGAPVTVREVCTLYAPELDTQPLYTVQLLPGLHKRRSYDALELVDALLQASPLPIDVRLVGAPACSLRTKPAKKRLSLPGIAKAAVIALLLFFGGGMAIINYHTDAGMADAHTTVAQALGGGESGELWMSIAYAAGVAGGILLFAGIGNKKQPNMLELESMEYTQKLEDYEDIGGKP